MPRVGIVMRQHVRPAARSGSPTHDVAMVPLKVHFGDERILDWIDLTPDEFYAKLAASTVLPKTSQPSPADFAARLRAARRGGRRGDRRRSPVRRAVRHVRVRARWPRQTRRSRCASSTRKRVSQATGLVVKAAVERARRRRRRGRRSRRRRSTARRDARLFFVARHARVPREGRPRRQGAGPRRLAAQHQAGAARSTPTASSSRSRRSRARAKAIAELAAHVAAESRRTARVRVALLHADRARARRGAARPRSTPPAPTTRSSRIGRSSARSSARTRARGRRRRVPPVAVGAPWASRGTASPRGPTRSRPGTSPSRAVRFVDARARRGARQARRHAPSSDLLRHYPFRYLDLTRLATLARRARSGTEVTVVGTVHEVTVKQPAPTLIDHRGRDRRRHRRAPRRVVQPALHRAAVPRGRARRVRRHGRARLRHEADARRPFVEKLARRGGRAERRAGPPGPPRDRGAVDRTGSAGSCREALDDYGDVPDHLPVDAAARARACVPLAAALRARSTSRDDAAEARRARDGGSPTTSCSRCSSGWRCGATRSRESTPGIAHTARRAARSPRCGRRCRSRSPATRQRAIAEILADMASPHPMNRMLLGDVGTGKTRGRRARARRGGRQRRRRRR